MIASLTLFVAGSMAANPAEVIRIPSRSRSIEEIRRAEKDPARVTPLGQLPADERLGPARTTNDPYHPFVPPNSLGEWEARAAEARTRLRVALGLWPWPEKTPLNPVIHGKIDKGDYTIEKVWFASVPGHYVCGNLYRPKGRSGRLPAILTPHGHWANGRLHDAGDKEVARQLAGGGERYRANARYLLQAQMASLARLGCVVFHFDMVGYADSLRLAHQSFDDATSILWGQSLMGLQTWNVIRSLDFLSGLADVDPARIGVTGASGGGTQTFLLGALDPRPATFFPAVMVSTAMQGGCVCENCPLVRVGTGNVEFAALAAPKPLGMTGALDWTREIETKGLPELKRLYALYGVPDAVMARAFPQFDHNYNQVARELMYAWMNQRLNLGWAAEQLSERPIDPVSPAELSVFDAHHPPPSDWLGTKELLASTRQAIRRQWRSFEPQSPADVEPLKETLAGALRGMIADSFPRANEITVDDLGKCRVGAYDVDRLIIGRAETRPLFRKDAIPAAVYMPAKWTGRMVVWVDPAGHAGLFDPATNQPVASVKRLVDAGVAVLAPDVFLTGEFHRGERTTPGPLIDPRYAGYTWGFNRTLLANRVHDILTALGVAKRLYGADDVDLVGVGEAGPWAILARIVAGDKVRRAAVELAGFSFLTVRDLADPMMLPAARRYGDIMGMAHGCAPGELFVTGTEGYSAEDLASLSRTYALAGNPTGLVLAPRGASAAREGTAWLLR